VRPRRDGAVMTDTQKQTVRCVFMDLEPDILDLVRAAKLVFQLASDEQDLDELLHFSIRQCRELAAALEEKYHTSWCASVSEA
jgi:hypothetical protein